MTTPEDLRARANTPKYIAYPEGEVADLRMVLVAAADTIARLTARLATAETLAHAVMRDGNADDYSAVLEAALDAWRTPQDPADA